jgi:hypothetical protein
VPAIQFTTPILLEDVVNARYERIWPVIQRIAAGISAVRRWFPMPLVFTNDFDIRAH